MLNRRICRGKYFRANRFLKIKPGTKGHKTATIKKGINRLHKHINKRQAYLRFWDYKHGIRSFTYLDIYQYEDIPVYAYKMISVICEYFDCIAVWDKIMVPNTLIALRTVKVYGYSPDIWLAKYYIVRMLVRFKYSIINKEAEYLKRGYDHNKLIRKISLYSRSKLKQFGDLWEGYLIDRKKSKYHYEKRRGILNYLQKNVKLNYGNRRWKHKPNIIWAYCRFDTYKQNKILKYENYRDAK